MCDGTWTPVHADTARHIRAQARMRAEALVPWPRRAALATTFEETALAILSEVDPAHPLAETLSSRLRSPWDRAVGSRLPCPPTV